MKCPFLVGAKLYLRPLEKEDAALLATWINDPEVRNTLNRYRPMNLLEEEEFLARVTRSENDLALGIVIRNSDKFIGATGLHQMDSKNRKACFGIFIGDRTEWGNGYGTEATQLVVKHGFETLNLNRIWLLVFEYNPRGIRAYERVGFKREAILRQEVFHGGRYWNAYLMAILREEWDAQRARS